MSVLPSKTSLGVLEILEVFQYYDGPKLFSAYNKAGSLFLAFWLGDEFNEISLDKWLYVPVSKTRLDNIKAGVIDLLTACREAEDEFVWIVEVPFSTQVPASALVMSVGTISDDDLPLPGSKLQIATHTIPDIEPILLRALRSKADILDISLEEFDSLRSEVGIRGLGATMISVQNCVDSLYAAAKGYKSRRIPDRIIEKSKLQAVDTYPSSFGIRLEAKQSINNIFNENDLFSTLLLFIKLIKLAGTPDILVVELKRLNNNNVAIKYLGLFDALIKSKISFKATWGRPSENAELQSAQVTLEQANTAFALLRQSIEEYVEIINVDCVLEAIDLRRQTFGLTDIESRLHYEGKIDEHLISDATRVAATVPANYIASLRQNQKLRPYTDQVEAYYTLLSLEEK
jgi:hypothetical protein